MRLLMIASAFLSCSWPALFVYLGGVKPKLDINDVLGKATEASDSPHSSFLGEMNSF